ncbi:unnamed protein product [Rotaria socialis]|uniref:Uncharacterized protein n=1 Tax=Rotaria socialis TaxID=392032 RepID=A0A821NHF7_9BILA|nr:unnamed protein product [Rotaria socialis]CAF4786316.1 unnamed protein product [Rotaria socialis]
MLTWHNLQSLWHEQRNRLQGEFNRMMLAEFGMIFLTTLSIVILNIYTLTTQSLVKSQLRIAQENLWSAVFNLVSFTSHVGYFYTYMIAFRVYRRNVRIALWCRRETRATAMEAPIRIIELAPTSLATL